MYLAVKTYVDKITKEYANKEVELAGISYGKVTVLIGTGMRLGEFSGLRWDDVDFEENYIDVNHQAVYYSHGDRKCR